jgi:hypothetical protein
MKLFLLLVVLCLSSTLCFAKDQIAEDIKGGIKKNCDASSDRSDFSNQQKLIFELLILSEEFYKFTYKQCHDTFYSAAGHKVYRSQKIDECFANILSYFANSFDLYCLQEYANELREIVKKCSEKKEQGLRYSCYKAWYGLKINLAAE